MLPFGSATLTPSARILADLIIVLAKLDFMETEKHAAVRRYVVICNRFSHQTYAVLLLQKCIIGNWQANGVIESGAMTLTIVMEQHPSWSSLSSFLVCNKTLPD